MFTSVNAEESIGDVNKVKTWSYGTRVYQEREGLFTRDGVYSNEIIETPENGAVWIIFNDDTELFLSENGRLSLDKFIYDADNADSMVINLTKGLFRFITGAIAPEKIKITTPVATIGIRGTDIEIMIDDYGMTATAFEGVITVTVPGLVVQTDGCQTIEMTNSGPYVDIRPCPIGGPSIGPATFATSHSGGGGSYSTPSSEPDGPSNDGPSNDGPSNDGPSGGPGNGNGNAGNSGNGGGNTNGSGPGTGNNGQNNGRGGGHDNGGGGRGNGGK